jgi:hypothetical protein
MELGNVVLQACPTSMSEVHQEQDVKWFTPEQQRRRTNLTEE